MARQSPAFLDPSLLDPLLDPALDALLASLFDAALQAFHQLLLPHLGAHQVFHQAVQ
ncbi:MAG: hypothetical protein ACRDIE_19815 [Chloroflexota bacterium]